MPPASTPAPLSRHFRLLSMRVRGGYFDGLDVPLAFAVICVIGGKGSGKTTLFELIRFAFDLPIHDSKHDVRGLVKKNLGNGTVQIGFETEHGVRAMVERAWKDERPRYMTEDGEPMAFASCPIDLYGQDEMESVGNSAGSQLALIDRLAGDDLRRIAAEVKDATERLREGAKALLALEKEIAALESDASEARAIDELLKPLLAASGPGDELTKAHARKSTRTREAHTVKLATQALAEARGQVEPFGSTVRRRLAVALPPELRESPNAALVLKANEQLAAVSGAIEDLVTTALRQIDAAAVAVTAEHEKLSALHSKDDEAYDALLARQKEDHVRSGERTRLQERLAVVSRAVPELDAQFWRHAELRHAQDALADHLGALRDQRGAARARFEAACNPDIEPLGVKITIGVGQDDAAFRALLRDIFKATISDQPRWLVDKVAKLTPSELVSLVRAGDAARLAELTDMKRNGERAQHVIAALTRNEHLYALQSVEIDDVGTISMKHGETPKDIAECSPGQRCGAVLPLLLLLRGGLLAIDQPDDNVDPDFLCNEILPRILAAAGTRQFFLVTHHANVPVLAASQQIIYVESNGKAARLEAQGDIAGMKRWVLKKLEGGNTAFEARRKLYELEEGESEDKGDKGDKRDKSAKDRT